MHSSKGYIRTVKFTHITVLFTQILFLWIAIWVILPHHDKRHEVYYVSFVALTFVVGIFTAYKLCIKYINKGKKKRGIREKLEVYIKALFSQWAVFFIMTLSAIFAYIMTAEKLFIFASAFSIILFWLNRPTIKRTIADLDLDNNEARILRTPDAAL